MLETGVPALSVVVVVYNIPRAVRRTLFSLSASYQRGIAADDYEIIVVDNGSTPPFDARSTEGLAGQFRTIRIDPAPKSPVRAANAGLAAARGDVIGLMIDGARIVTPGLLRFALAAARLHPRAVVASPGWYLGADFQSFAAEAGYDEAEEDTLLDSIEWPVDGYRLFEISTMDESSVGGCTKPLTETNTLFLHRDVWHELGGMDERFDAAGGGLVNLDTYRRATALEGAERVVLLGEGSFHQIHGGVSTNAPVSRQSENWDGWHGQYQHIRGQEFAFEPCYATPPILLGTLPAAARPHLWAAPATMPSLADTADETVRTLLGIAARAMSDGRFGSAAEALRVARARFPREPSILRLLALTAPATRLQPPDAHRAVAVGDALRAVGDLERARDSYHVALGLDGNSVGAHLGLAEIRMPGDQYLVWLRRLYELLAPATAIEIGIYQGQSLALHRPPTIAIGVDPEPRVTFPLRAETHLFAETSDEFFARGHAASALSGRAVDLGFIDGLHLYEQALRDFMHLEAMSGPASVILIHDTVPLDERTQRRELDTQFHTGDVWRLVLCLRAHRPDLDVFTIAAPPTGLTVVSGLNRDSRVLATHYDALVAEFLAVPFDTIAGHLADAVGMVAGDFTAVRARLQRRLRIS